MQLNPYISFNGQCDEAFKFYEKVLGGKIMFKMTYGESPMASQSPGDSLNKIMHVSLKVGDRILMGSDAPPQHYEAAKGFHVRSTDGQLREKGVVPSTRSSFMNCSACLEVRGQKSAIPTDSIPALADFCHASSR
jgi:uncharacterized glyoxalase superfamily protein PhnB